MWSRVAVWTLICFVVLGGGVGSGALTHVSVAPSGEGFDSLAADRFVKGYLGRTGLPGAAVVVVQGERIVHLAGYGTDGSSRSLTPDTPLPIASLSKSVTALAVMQLVESGRVRLDNPVTAYLPEFRMADERADRITVAQLLNQTSGMADTTYPAMHVPVADSLAAAVTQLSSARLATDPGSRWHYHNPNYQVLARLVEAVGGVDFDEYLHRHVFGPLGMDSSRSVVTTADFAGIEPGHVDGWGFALPAHEPRWFVAGSGGVISTVRDLSRWLILQLGSDQPTVITRASIESTHSASDPGRRYGYGWSVSGPASHRRVSHIGALFTYTAYQVIVPSTGYGIAVLANRGYTLGSNDAEAIGRGLLDLAEGRPATVALPWWRLADFGLAALTLALVPFTVWSVRRLRRRARPGRRFAIAAPAAVLAISCLALLFALPTIGGSLAGQRDISLWQVAHVTPAVVTQLLVLAVAATAIAVAAVATVADVDPEVPPAHALPARGTVRR